MPHSFEGERWLDLLGEGDSDGAWDDFVSRYRRVIFAAIRHYTAETDEVMDVFAHVCEQLRDRDLRRLRAFRPDTGTRVSTWLVAVVRNLTVDWFRLRDGRRNVAAGLQDLPPIQREIFRLVAHRGMSYREAYETLAQSERITFGAFLRELRDLHRSVAGRASLFHELIGRDPTEDLLPGSFDESPDPSVVREILDALDSLPPDVRAAVQLFVVEGLTAGEVARTLGWDSSKKVYNTVYRTLEQLKTRLHARENQG